MKGIRTVNLMWERKIRGAYPVSPFALAEDGTLAVAVPRPLEPRAYDLTHLRTDGSAEIQGGFSAETLLKLALNTVTADGIGMTADDVYLFRTQSKSRFLGEKRVLYVDSSLSADGQRLAVIFSDLAGISYALGYGKIDGHVDWTCDMDTALSTVCLSRDGLRMAVGTEIGTLMLIDSGMRPLWEFGQGEPVCALACSFDGMKVAYGTTQGTVGLINGDGSRLWEARLPGEVVALALTAEGSFCTALCRSSVDTTSTTLFCIVGEGQVGWEYTVEKRLLGLALSPQGLFLATGARDGTLSVYEVVPGEVQAGNGQVLRGSEALSQAEELEKAGDLTTARKTLQLALDATPADLNLFDAFTSLHNRWLETGITEAQQHFDNADFHSAMEILGTMWAEDRTNVTLVSLLNQASMRRANQLLAEAENPSASPDTDVREQMFQEAISLYQHHREARERLALLYASRAEVADREADALLAQGDLEAGVVALERAQAVAASEEREKKLRRAHTALEFAAGMSHYNAKQYQQAIFQFKKALLRDPEHREAQRYLGYAEKFQQDTTTEDINDRFSRLE